MILKAPKSNNFLPFHYYSSFFLPFFYSIISSLEDFLKNVLNSKKFNAI